MLSQNIDNNNSTAERKTSLGAMLLLNSAGVHDTKVRHNKRDFQSFILFIKIIKYCLFHRSRPGKYVRECSFAQCSVSKLVSRVLVR